jgi:GNAT superfamily N-acetyltransferase
MPMITETKNQKKVSLDYLDRIDIDPLVNYLQQLSPETKSRFGPHPFQKEAIQQFYASSTKYTGYIATDAENNSIIAYSIAKQGHLDYDRNRLVSYGLALHEHTDCAFAPSVADGWQGLGIGNAMLRFIISDLKNRGINRLILWGGVQKDNEKAVNYYLKNGFKILGQFTHQGENYDMCLIIE